MNVVDEIPLFIENSPAVWAAEHRKIKSSIRNDELVNYSFEGYEFLKEIHDSPYEVKTLIKGAQIGGTEAALNIAFWGIDMHKKDVMYLLSDDGSASDFSAGRFDPAIETSERLSNLFTEVSNVGHKRAGIANLYVRGAGGAGGRSRSKLKSVPINILIMDEFDEIPPEKIPLAEERVSAKTDYKIFKLSTPSIPNFGIDAEYKKSSMGIWIVWCPRCNAPQNLTLANLDWDGTDPNTGVIKCKKCKVPFTHQQKMAMIADGQWEHAFPYNDHRGYWLPQFYSPTQDAIRICKKLKDAQSDKLKEQEFYNSTLGMGHIVEGAQLTKMDIEMCRGTHEMMNSANGAVTCGIDVGSWLHVDVATYHGKKKNVIWVGKVKEFEDLDKIMTNFKVKIAVIDIAPETRKAREFAHRHLGKVYMCAYGRSREIIAIDDKTYQVTAGRTETLDITLDRHRSSGDLISLPKNTPSEYMDNLCAPVRVYEKSNGLLIPVYREIGPDHYAHAANYNEIAHMIFYKGGGGFISNDLFDAMQNMRQTRESAKQNW